VWGPGRSEAGTSQSGSTRARRDLYTFKLKIKPRRVPRRQGLGGPSPERPRRSGQEQGERTADIPLTWPGAVSREADRTFSNGGRLQATFKGATGGLGHLSSSGGSGSTGGLIYDPVVGHVHQRRRHGEQRLRFDPAPRRAGERGRRRRQGRGSWWYAAARPGGKPRPVRRRRTNPPPCFGGQVNAPEHANPGCPTPPHRNAHFNSTATQTRPC